MTAWVTSPRRSWTWASTRWAKPRCATSTAGTWKRPTPPSRSARPRTRSSFTSNTPRPFVIASPAAIRDAEFRTRHFGLARSEPELGPALPVVHAATKAAIASRPGAEAAENVWPERPELQGPAVGQRRGRRVPDDDGAEP